MPPYTQHATVLVILSSSAGPPFEVRKLRSMGVHVLLMHDGRADAKSLQLLADRDSAYTGVGAAAACWGDVVPLDDTPRGPGERSADFEHRQL